MRFRLKNDPTISIEAMVLPWPGSYIREDNVELMFSSGSWLLRHDNGISEVMDSYRFGFLYEPDTTAESRPTLPTSITVSEVINVHRLAKIVCDEMEQRQRRSEHKENTHIIG